MMAIQREAIDPYSLSPPIHHKSICSPFLYSFQNFNILLMKRRPSLYAIFQSRWHQGFKKPHNNISFLHLTLWTPEVGIPTLRKLPYAARRRYTVGTVCYRTRQKSVYLWHGVYTPAARRRYTDFVF